jgi:hypothetical protein
MRKSGNGGWSRVVRLSIERLGDYFWDSVANQAPWEAGSEQSAQD